MSDELTKLAKEAYCSKDALGSDVYAELAVRAHHAAEKAKDALTMSLGGAEGPKLYAINNALIALDALILTPPVDPVVDALDEIGLVDGEWVDANTMASRLREALAKHGLELRTVADGGGA